MMDIIIEDQRLSDECGCPEEDLIIGNVFFTIHLEEDGSGHIFADTGDWDAERFVECGNDITVLREKALEWMEELNKLPMR